MRWLIVGPYPPEQGSGPAAAAAMVAERLAAGDTVHAVSPRPTAAHVHLPLVGVQAIWALARLAREQHAEGIWLRVEPGILLTSGTDRRRALAERLALAALLSRFRTSVLDVGDVGLLPGGRAGRPVFASATRFVTHSDKDTATLLASGAPPAKVQQVELPAPSSPPGAPSSMVRVDDASVDYPPPTRLVDLPGDRTAIEAAVRARAAELAAARAAATP